MARDYAPKTLEGIASAVARDVYKKVGNKIAKEMTHAYIYAIREFYNDYHPKAYKRKYRSYYFADADGVRAYSKFVKLDADGKGFTVGLRISPDNIKAPYRSLRAKKGSFELTQKVFTNTWVLGQHGGRLPWNIIPDDEKPSHPDPTRWIARPGGFYWEPPVTTPSPMEIMDTWYRDYATEKNLNEITKGVVTSSINRYLLRYKSRYGNNE